MAMATRQTTMPEALAQGIDASKRLLARYLPGFTDENRTRQAPGLPNHVAWCLGHCAMTMHEVAFRIGDGLPDRPEGVFVRGDGTKGDAQRFDTESICFGSQPADDPSRYPRLARCVEIYEAAVDRLAAAVRKATPGRLEELTKWGPREIPLWMAVQTMTFHNGMHTGQIADLRRAMGMGGVLG